MKLLLIHAWNEKEVAYRGKFSALLSYPSLTLAVIYSLIPEGMFEKIDVVDENSQKVKYDKETSKWFSSHIGYQTTVCKCEKCNLFYKPSLGHKCRKAV